MRVNQTIAAVLVIVTFVGCGSKEPPPRRRGEAELNLNAINKGADAEYAENGQYPVGSVELTPSTPCCEFPDKKCPVVLRDWAGVPVWDALGFEMTRPFFFQYAYRSDGKTFEAIAVGDLDCDGNAITYTLNGSAEKGSPTSTLTRPARAD